MTPTRALFVSVCLLAACDSKPKDEPKARAKPEAKEDAPKADTAPEVNAPPAKKLKYRKGQTAPGGMTPQEVREYAQAQGDPKEGVFTLEDAFAGDETLADTTKGTLTATLTTTMGAFECELFETDTPATVANFVGLARGTRPWYDKKSDTWKEGEPYYADMVWHRVMTGFMAQTGDRSGSGSGGAGFVIVDEIDTKKLRHKWKGTLSMANSEKPNTGTSQFFVTVKPTAHLDGKHAVFGKCDASVVKKITGVKVNPARNNRPFDPIKLESIAITRK
ncbi:MAG: peptidylprolyl isomerase [Nannocystaceae bacterium]|nr:peptidylprolyl isomerase [Nannocystaceae bacterium]